MVSKAREDFPEPDNPVNTINRLRGSSSETFFRLCSRAPLMTIDSADIGPSPGEGVRLYRQPVTELQGWDSPEVTSPQSPVPSRSLGRAGEYPLSRHRPTLR